MKTDGGKCTVPHQRTLPLLNIPVPDVAFGLMGRNERRLRIKEQQSALTLNTCEEISYTFKVRDC